MKNTPNNSQQLRHEIQNIVQARESLEKNEDISGSMVKITRALNNVQPLMNKQTQYIKNFLQGNETSDPTSKESESRRYIARICDIAIGEMTELLNAAEHFFSLQIRTSWLKIRNEFQHLLQIEREQVDKSKSNILELMFKIVNMKDKLMKDFLRSLIYRKCLLWKDLNIVNQGFVHSEKKKITKMMEDYITNKKYAPTRPLFVLPDLSTSGIWSLNKQELQDSSLAEFLKLLDEEMEQIFDTVRNYSGLNEQQRNHEDIRRNQNQIKSLRAEIEQTHISYQLLERKYREAVSKDEKMDIVQMKEKLKAAEDALEVKDRELKELTYSYRDYTRDMNSQKEKIKELQSDLQKITAVQLKKLKEIQMVQSNLSEEFTRIHKNMKNFGSMFEFESEGKKSLADQIINLKATIEKMAGILGNHKNANLQLKDEIRRLNLVILELGSQLREQKLRET